MGRLGGTGGLPTSVPWPSIEPQDVIEAFGMLATDDCERRNVSPCHGDWRTLVGKPPVPPNSPIYSSEACDNLKRFTQSCSLVVDEAEVIVEVFDVVFDHGVEGDFAATVVGASAEEGGVGEVAEDSGELAAADFEEDEGVFQGLLVSGKALDVSGLIGVEQRWVVFDHDPLHPIDGNRVAIDQVDHDLLNGPEARSGASVVVLARQAFHGPSQLDSSRFEPINQLSIHRIVHFLATCQQKGELNPGVRHGRP